ncbi:Cellulase (glycosyl hydrolase family 5 protein) [Ceratobasidium sp. AG-Ba]|nr:Cellulase (glycosyl hydrolase family 5 protein) [Ceratobasidium sp. AG-Ba]
MPPVPRTSPATSESIPAHYVHTTAGHFVDAAGRVLLLRGVNLSGSTKAPLDRPTQRDSDVWDVAEAGGESFVGRPLNLDDGTADVHLARLRAWGFNCLRFVFTWEALEHEGPGKYDYEYIKYTIRVLRRCAAFGFKVYMDPHQDVWSRFSGGSGAPYWTLLACGLNPRNFTATQAALVHFEQPDPAAYPAMIWGTNYSRFVSQTIFTLFFAGRDYAPRCIIDGVNIQDWLQRHFINACGVLADAIKSAGDLYDVCIIGWDSINEPGEGFLGIHDLNVVPPHQSLKKGTCPTPAQGIRLASGIPQTVENWAFGALGPKRDGYVTIDPAGRTVWSSPGTEEDAGDGSGDRINRRWGWRRAASWPLGKCIWALHGVWPGPDAAAHKGEIPILKPDYFASPPFDPSRGVVFVADYWRPHWRDYIARIRQAQPEAIFFLQPPVFVQPPPLDDEDFRGRGVYSAHYYDGLTLMTRHWNWFNADALGLLRGKYSSVLGALRIGEAAIRKCLRDQLGMFKDDVRDILGPYPTLIGEIGVPFDMDGKRSYGLDGNGGKYIGDYTNQTRALDCSLNGADGTNMINWTLWTYCPDNSHVWGDGWNLEDLSLWSADDADRDRGAGQGFLVESSQADLLGRDRRDGSLSVIEDEESRNRSESTLGTLGMVPMTGMTLQAQPRAQPTMTTTKRPTCSSPEPDLRISADRLYDFMTVGARGVGALARPWPIASVGTPTNLDFEISKAKFELKIKVGPADRVWGGREPIKMETDDEEDEELGTEIYIPLVHFAADSAFEGGVQVCPDETPQPREATLEDDETLVAHSRSQSKSSGIGEDGEAGPGQKKRRGTTATLRRARANTVGTLAPILAATTEPSPSSIPLSAQSIMGTLVESEMLALEVEVSEGKWAVDGQVLRWWYDVPGEGEPEKEVVIKVRRKGGPIKGVMRGFSGMGPDGASIRSNRSTGGLWEAICPPGGCVIA